MRVSVRVHLLDDDSFTLSVLAILLVGFHHVRNIDVALLRLAHLVGLMQRMVDIPTFRELLGSRLVQREHRTCT